LRQSRPGHEEKHKDGRRRKERVYTFKRDWGLSGQASSAEYDEVERGRGKKK